MLFKASDMFLHSDSSFGFVRKGKINLFDEQLNTRGVFSVTSFLTSFLSEKKNLRLT